MTAPENRAVTVLLTEEHVRRMIEDHLLQANEISETPCAPNGGADTLEPVLWPALS